MITTTITAIIEAAGLNAGDYPVAALAREAARMIAQSEDFGDEPVAGISEADIWEGLAGSWGIEPATQKASDDAWSIAETYVDDFGPDYWLNECQAAAIRNARAAA